MRKDEIRVGVLGLGFIGRTHLQAYRAAAEAGFPNRVVAVCDTDPDRRSGKSGPAGNLELSGGRRLFDPAAVRAYADPAELLGDPEVELVSVCTPTPTHVELAVGALEAGKHVLVEKPVALELSQAARLAAAAEGAGTLCMPALCMRFWPGWDWLKERVEAGTFGAPRSASFRRRGHRPDWSPIYADPALTGGALFDLHVHDADFLAWCFGTPLAVRSTGTIDSVSTAYELPGDGLDASAVGGWDREPEEPFEMRYDVVFDDARADFELGRESPLLLTRAGKTEAVELDAITGWDAEVRHLLTACASGDADLVATASEAVGLTRLLEAEGRSLRSGRREVVS